MTVHWKREIDTPEFRRFLKEAVAAYGAQSRAGRLNPDDLTPWKVLGRKWHLSRKGFPTNKRVAWEPEVLGELVQLLEESCPGAVFDWSNKQVVYVRPNGDERPCAEIHTKRRGGVDLALFHEPGRFALGRVAALGRERQMARHRDGRDAVRIRIDAVEQVRAPDLRAFLQEHTRESPGVRN